MCIYIYVIYTLENLISNEDFAMTYFLKKLTKLLFIDTTTDSRNISKSVIFKLMSFHGRIFQLLAPFIHKTF